MVNQVQNGVDNINSTTSFHRFSAYNNEALYWNFHELVALRERDSYSIRRPDVGYDSAVFAQQTKSSKRRFKGSSQKLDRLLAQLNGADAPHNALFPALGSDALAVLKGLVRSQDFLRHRLHNMRYLRPVPRAVVGDLAQSAVSWQRCIKQVRECFPGCSIRMCIALEAGHPVHLLNPVLSLLNTTGKDPTFPPCSITGIHFVEPTHCKAQQLNKIYAEILDDSSIVPPLRRLLIDSALEQLQWHFSVCPPLPTLPVSLAQLWLWRNPKPSQEAVKVKRLIFQRCRGLHFLNMPHPRYRYPDLLHVMSWKRLQGFHRAFSCTRRPAVKPSILHLFSPRINGEQQDVHHTLLTTRCRKSYVTGTTMAQKDLYKKVRNGVDLWDPPVRQSGPIKLFRDVGPIRKRDVEYNARRSLEKRLLTSLLMPRYIKQNRNDCLKGSPTLCRALGVLANEASHKAPVTQCVSRRTKLGRTVTRGNEPPDSGASSFSHVLGQHIEIEPRQLLREQRNALIALFGTRSCFIKRMLMKTSSCHLFWRQAAQKLYVGCRRGCDRHWSIGSLCPSEATPAVTRVSYTRFVRAVTVGVWLLWFSQYRHPCHIKRRWRRMCQGSNAPTSTSGLKSPMCLEKLVYQCVRWIVLYGQKTLVFQGTWKDFHATVGAHLWALLLPYNGSTISSDCPGSRRPCRDKKHLPLTDSQRNVILRAQYVSLLRLCCGETNPMERFCAFRSRKYWRWLQAIIRGFASKEKPSPTTVRLPCSDSRETHALRKQKFQTLGDLVQAGDAQLHFSLLFQRAAAENSVLLILGSPIMGSELFSALGLFSENQKIDPLVISHSGVAPESNTGINGDGVNQRPITPVGKPSPYWVKRFILRGPVSVPREELLSNLVTVSPAALACEEANAYLPLAQSIRRCNAQTWEFELSHYVKENQFRV